MIGPYSKVQCMAVCDSWSLLLERVSASEFEFLSSKMWRAGFTTGMPIYFTVCDGAIYVFPKKMKGVEIKIST